MERFLTNQKLQNLTHNQTPCFENQGSKLGKRLTKICIFFLT